MTEIVINRCSRGTLLSDAGRAEYLSRKSLEALPDPLDRTDPVLISLLRENPADYGGHCAHLHYVTVPDGMGWRLMNKGNVEWIAAGGSGG
jgi:hypothetical protein